MHILIVEDNTLVASGIQTGLELHGFTSNTAASVAHVLVRRLSPTAARTSGRARLSCNSAGEL